MNRYCYQYPHPAVTVDCVIFGFDGEELNVLLIRRGVEPFRDSWALPGGFMKIDESAEDAARRELMEETSLDAEYLEQFHTYSLPNRDPRERVVTIAFVALVKMQEVHGGDDAQEAGWFLVNSLPQLAFDHNEILKDALRYIREKIHFQPLGFELLPRYFTMKELQKLYETILGTEFDRRNFSKKILHFDIIKSVENSNEEEVKRAAAVRFAATCPKQNLTDIQPSRCIESTRSSDEEENDLSTPQKFFAFLDSGKSSKTSQNSRQSRGKLYEFDEENYKKIKKRGFFEF